MSKVAHTHFPRPGRLLSALAFSAMLLPMSAGADVLIDPFSGPDSWNHTGTGSFSELSSSVLGGVRELAFDYSSPLPGNSVSLVTSLGMLASGTLNLPGDAQGKTFSLTYDGAIAGPGGLNVSLTQASAIVVNAMADFWTSSLGNSQMSVSLTDANGQTGTLSLTPGIASNTFGDIRFDLNDVAFSGINLGHIHGISLSYTAAPSADAFFDYVKIESPLTDLAMPVPEADTLPLMLVGLGLLGLLARRYKR